MEMNRSYSIVRLQWSKVDLPETVLLVTVGSVDGALDTVLLGSVDGALDDALVGTDVEVTCTVSLLAVRSAVAPVDAAFTCKAFVNAPDVTELVRMDRSSSTDLTVSY